jgi:hypothetical protein
MKHSPTLEPAVESPANRMAAPGKQSSAGALVVDVLRPQDDAEVVKFLDQVGEAPNGAMVLGYHYPENREMLLGVLQPEAHACYFAARSTATGELQGILPGFMKHARGLACYNSLPFFGPNVGVLAAAHGGNEYAQIAGALHAAAIDYARGQGALTAVFYSAFNPAGADLGHSSFEGDPGVIQVERLTQYLDLSGLTEPNWPADIRYDLRKARGAGVEVCEDVCPDDIGDIFEIYQANCTQHGIPLKPRSCIESLVKARPSSCRIRAYTAKLAGKTIGALIVLWGPKTASYFLPCSSAEHRSLQPGSLLIDHACRDALSHGIRYWNWESSPNRDGGVFRFKKKWGSIETPFRLIVVPLTSLESLNALGPDAIAAAFPFFYVFPFDRLASQQMENHES